MRSTSAILLAAALGCAASPLARRQDVSSSAAESASAAVDSASSSLASVTSSASRSASSASRSVSSAASSSSAAAAAPSATNATEGFLAAIRARQAATGFVSLLTGNPDVLNSVVALVGTQQPYTLFLPGSVSNVDGNTSDPTVVTSLVQYHLIPQNVSAASIPTNSNTVYQTALQNYAVSPNLTVPGSQVAILNKNQYGTTTVVGQSNATVLGNSTYQNFLFKLINQALVVPTNVSTTISSVSTLSSLYGLLSGNSQLVSAVDTLPAVTIFAPENSAVSPVASSLRGADATTIQTAIQNHVIPGATVYSSQIMDGMQGPNANQQQATLNVNATGAFITSGGVTAQIIRTDIVAANGVVHVIDRVLFTPPTAAASSAASSASGASRSASSSAAATSAVESASSAAAAATESASAAAASATASA